MNNLDLNVHIGQKIREKRRLASKTQTDLAKAVGVTFQQIQKFESGKNRVAADQLYKIGRELKTPIAQFYSGYKQKKETIENIEQFAEIYKGIKDPTIKRNIDNILIQISKAQSNL